MIACRPKRCSKGQTPKLPQMATLSPLCQEPTLGPSMRRMSLKCRTSLTRPARGDTLEFQWTALAAVCQPAASIACLICQQPLLVLVTSPATTSCQLWIRTLKTQGLPSLSWPFTRLLVMPRNMLHNLQMTCSIIAFLPTAWPAPITLVSHLSGSHRLQELRSFMMQQSQCWLGAER